MELKPGIGVNPQLVNQGDAQQAFELNKRIRLLKFRLNRVVVRESLIKILEKLNGGCGTLEKFGKLCQSQVRTNRQFSEGYRFPPQCFAHTSFRSGTKEVGATYAYRKRSELKCIAYRSPLNA